VNFAIVGCGHIAKKHAEAIKHTTDANLEAVCDRIPAAMEFYADEYGAKTYTDLADLMDNDAIDIVCICTPSGFHASIAVEAARAGKHIVVEKPIALTLKDADQIIEACEENNVKLAVVHPNRFRPVVREFRKILDENRLGKISHANATVRWNRNQEYYDQAAWRGTKEFDGGVLMNQAIHNLDLLLWFLGEADEVFSMEATRFRNIEAEDVSTGLIRFKNGSLGVVETAATIYPKNFEESFSIFGETGTIKIGGSNALYFEHLDVASLNDEDSNTLIEMVKQNPFGKPGHQWIIEDMIQAIKENRNPVVDGNEGRKALQLVLTFYESAEQGKQIRLREKISHK
jgi:UDP-N-acetyl-2-amino-2-deoxyglucuronate dehydrogenase